MEDKYKSLTAPELAGEDAFIRFVRFGDHQVEWDQWLQDNPGRKDVVVEAKYIVQTISGAHAEDLDAGSKSALWDRIHADINVGKSTPSIQTRVRLIRWTIVAAAAIAILFWVSNKRAVTEVIVQSGEKQEINLPEMSVVTVNAGSKVSYNKKKFTDDREILLDGEAYFHVSHGSKFTVVTTQGTITVMGTSFNVISRPGRFEVSCYTGRVRVEQGKDDVVEITGGEKCATENISEKLTPVTFDASSASPEWISGKFKFTDQPLSVVVAELERQYGVTVKLSPGIEHLRYTGLFESGDLEKADSLITWPLHLHASVSGKTVSISR